MAGQDDGAACRGFPTEWWFPARGDSAGTAKFICSQCRLREACLDYALSVDWLVGIWGGVTEGRRRILRRRAGKGEGGGAAHNDPAPL